MTASPQVDARTAGSAAQAEATRDIFFVSNSVDELGGVTTWSHQMARLFTARGHRVHVIGITPCEVPQDLGDEPLPYPTMTLYDGQPPKVRRHRGLRRLVDPTPRLQERARDAGMREQAKKLDALFADARPGAVVIVTQVWAMEWVKLADTRGLTVIGMTHESFEYSRATSRFARVKRHYVDADWLLALTREDADRWIVAGMNHVGFMPNPLPHFPDTPSPRTERTVLSIGRLSDQKGIDMLLDAWAEVAPRHPDWKLSVYGDGEDEEALHRQCTRLGLDGSVAWQGRTGDVPGALRTGSVFVQSSRGEGFPLALMEAMAAGVPCVAFDCAPGVREIVRDGEDGLLAPVGNTGELARQLHVIMSDAELRDEMGNAARTNIQRYTTDRVVQMWEGLFLRLER